MAFKIAPATAPETGELCRVNECSRFSSGLWFIIITGQATMQIETRLTGLIRMG